MQFRGQHGAPLVCAASMVPAEAPDRSAESPTPAALEDPDLLFLVFTFLPAVNDAQFSVLLTNHAWRAAALRPDLPHWSRCDRALFMALAEDFTPVDLILRLSALGTSSEGASDASTQQLATHWCCESVEKLLQAKPLLQALDLSHCFVSDAEAVARLALRLPPSLHTLSLHRGCNQPDAMLRHLLRGLPALPRLRCLDLRGILDERTLAGLRLLDRTQGGHAATSLAVSLPALETLSVGFPLHSVLGAREGEQFLTAQAALAPRLRHVGCRVSAEAAWGASMGPLDVVCRCCGGALYERLDAYVVCPAQQAHITYEIHTDEPPLAAAVRADGADDSRLWCARSCQGHLWLVDHGSAFVRRVLGRKYAIACGPPVAHTPALAMAIPARPPPAEGSDGAEAAGAPPDPDLEALPPYLWMPQSN